MTVSEKLRLVQGLHSHAEMFGFHWDDGSDWTWHDVACKVADEVDAESAKLRELVRDAIAFLDDDDPCRRCGYDTECFEQNGLNVAYEGGCLMLNLLVNRAREFGVEVDE